MGIEVETISNHNLDTSNIKALAKDLSNRLNVNIEYGYFNSPSYNKFLKLADNSTSEVVLGEIIIDKKLPKLFLEDNRYQVKELYKRFGMDIFKEPEIVNSFITRFSVDEVIQIHKEYLSSEHYSLEWPSKTQYYIYYAVIYDQVVLYGTDYYASWFMLEDILTSWSFEDDCEFGSILEFRKEVHKITNLFGGTHAYYFRDDLEPQHIGSSVEDIELDWQLFEKTIENMWDKKSRFIDLPEYFISEEYRNHIHDNYFWNLIIKDDFRDLK